MPEATLKELAALFDGRVVGDPETRVRGLAAIEKAGPGEITFISNPKYARHLATTRAAAVIVAQECDAPVAQIVCRNPYLAFARVLTHLYVKRPIPQGVLPGAAVDPAASLGQDVTIHPGCVVGARAAIGAGTILYPNVVVYPDVTIGIDCTVHAGVVIRESCRLGDRVIVQPSAVIGSDGFGFAPDGERYEKIPQVGIVVIEDDVEIGSGTCIDRAAMGETRIKAGVKLDNLVQIAHNVVVGEHTVMAAQAGISGSTTIGRHCTFGGQAAAAGHIKVGDNLTVGGRGGIAGDIEGNQVVSGVPAIPHKEWLKASMTFAHLPEMRRELTRLRKQVEDLDKLLKENESCN